MALIQGERDNIADDLVRLGNELHEMGVQVTEVPTGVVDTAVHFLRLGVGYAGGLELAGRQIVELQEKIQQLTPPTAPDISGDILDMHVEQIGAHLNAEHRAGGDDVIAAHNAYRDLKVALSRLKRTSEAIAA